MRPATDLAEALLTELLADPRADWAANVATIARHLTAARAEALETAALRITPGPNERHRTHSAALLALGALAGEALGKSSPVDTAADMAAVSSLSPT